MWFSVPHLGHARITEHPHHCRELHCRPFALVYTSQQNIASYGFAGEAQPGGFGETSSSGAGMRCIAVTNTHPAERLEEADKVVDSLEEVTVNTLESLLQ